MARASNEASFARSFSRCSGSSAVAVSAISVPPRGRPYASSNKITRMLWTGSVSGMPSAVKMLDGRRISRVYAMKTVCPSTRRDVMGGKGAKRR